ncbi:MAG: response regulator [Syntrophomonas sp.]
MRVYILDEQVESREQILKWLSENKKLTGIEVFEDYALFVEQVGKSPPDFGIIRLGGNEIPGLKVGEMVKQISPDVRIIFISDDRKSALDAYELGAYGYLLCPLLKDKFENCLKQIV